MRENEKITVSSLWNTLRKFVFGIKFLRHKRDMNSETHGKKYTSCWNFKISLVKQE